jgi:hypothetical protein
MLSTAFVCASIGLMTLVSFFGTNALFGPANIVSLALFLATLFVFVGRSALGLFRLVTGKGITLLVKPLAATALMVLALFLQARVHELGLKFLIATNQESLERAAIDVLSNTKENDYVWRSEFDLWPNMFAPTRASSWHQGGVLFLDFEGGSKAAVGICYNPKHLVEPTCSTHLFGNWYRFHS